MLHAFEHFIFGFKTAMFEPPDNAAPTKPETNFHYQQEYAHHRKIKPGECLRIKYKL